MNLGIARSLRFAGASVLVASAALLSVATSAPSAGASVHMFAPQAKFIDTGKIATSGITFGCQVPSSPIYCYGPSQIQNAYDITPLYNRGIYGAGSTVVIIDAYQSPTIQHDLHLFDRVFGLPDPTLNIIAPNGLTPFDQTDPNEIGWAGEITLDVEWAHTVAPGATIDLVLAASSADQDILNATKYAVDNNLGDVISQSFGEAETCMDPTLMAQQHQVFEEATNKGMTIFASAGDSGAAQPNCDGTAYELSASTPASDPLVTGVGGTQLTADLSTGAYHKEGVWNDQYGAGGGGFSTVYEQPDFQSGISGINGFRGVPDVSYNADVNGGVLAVWSSSGQGTDLVFIFGGTSAGSPQWAGITALADQQAGHRLGFLNSTLYHIALHDDSGHGERNPHNAFHDPVHGNNSFGGINGYSVSPGWDPATGVGTPDVANLLPLLTSENQGRDQSADRGATAPRAPTGPRHGHKINH